MARCLDRWSPASSATTCEWRLVSVAGDIFICSECQANAKKLLEIQDCIWAEIVDTDESAERTRSRRIPNRASTDEFRVDVLLEAKAHPLKELGRDLVQIGDDTCVEDRLLLGWAHLLEFAGSHDLPGHRSIVSPDQVSTAPCGALRRSRYVRHGSHHRCAGLPVMR